MLPSGSLHAVQSIRSLRIKGIDTLPVSSQPWNPTVLQPLNKLQDDPWPNEITGSFLSLIPPPTGVKIKTDITTESLFEHL